MRRFCSRILGWLWRRNVLNAGPADLQYFCAFDLDGLLRQSVDIVRKKVESHGREMEEPDYSVALGVEFPALLRQRLQSTGIVVEGCYVHQSPMVSYLNDQGSPVTCEAGDVLVVCRRVVRGKERLNVMLLQLKMSASDSYSVKSEREAAQLDVYRSWPHLVMGRKYDDSRYPSYDVKPATVTPGAQYLLVKDAPSLRFSASIPDDVMTADGPELACLLCDLINWQTGRPFACKANKNDDEWSRFIWGILLSIKDKNFTRSRGGYPRRTGQRMPKDLGEILFPESENSQEIPRLALADAQESERGLGVVIIDFGEMLDRVLPGNFKEFWKS